MNTTENKEYIYGDEERIDALDHLIFHEIGQQAQWAQTMKMWEERARQQRRHRLLPVLSNVASVAALFVLGLIVEAMVPGIKIADSLVDSPSAPAVEQTPVQPAPSSAVTPDTAVIGIVDSTASPQP